MCAKSCQTSVSTDLRSEDMGWAWLSPYRRRRKHCGWEGGAPASHGGELLLGSDAIMWEQKPPSKSPAVAVSDQQPLSGVTSPSLSLPSTHHFLHPLS